MMEKVNLHKNQADRQGNDSGLIRHQLGRLYSFTQSKWSEWMSATARRLSRAQLLAIWILLTISTGSYCMYLIVDSAFSVGSERTLKGSDFPIMRVNLNPGRQQQIALPDRNGYEETAKLRRYFDSLGRSPTGSLQYDSIRNARPGLLDTLKQLENYYKSN